MFVFIGATQFYRVLGLIPIHNSQYLGCAQYKFAICNSKTKMQQSFQSLHLEQISREMVLLPLPGFRAKLALAKTKVVLTMLICPHYADIVTLKLL